MDTPGTHVRRQQGRIILLIVPIIIPFFCCYSVLVCADFLFCPSVPGHVLYSLLVRTKYILLYVCIILINGHCQTDALGFVLVYTVSHACVTRTSTVAAAVTPTGVRGLNPGFGSGVDRDRRTRVVGATNQHAAAVFVCL